MQVQTKALYNLLRLNALTGDAENVQPWQVEDMRLLEEEEIFSRLQSLGIDMDRERFLLFAEECDTPEELTDCLLLDEKQKKDYDQIYLLFFELWRRNLIDKPSLSIFLDELDHRISLYLQGELKNDELIQDGLANLLEILDDNTDLGVEPVTLFSSFMAYCAYDIEAFLYEYILEQIEVGNDSYASELLEGFYPYMRDLKRFDFLRIQLLAASDIAEVNKVLKTIIKELVKNPDLSLQFEILEFMVEKGDLDLFIKLVQLTLSEITIEAEWKDLLEIVIDFYRRLDREEEEKVMQSLLKKRSTIPDEKKFSKEDEDVILFKKALKA